MAGGPSPAQGPWTARGTVAGRSGSDVLALRGSAVWGICQVGNISGMDPTICHWTMGKMSWVLNRIEHHMFGIQYLRVVSRILMQGSIVDWLSALDPRWSQVSRALTINFHPYVCCLLLILLLLGLLLLLLWLLMLLDLLGLLFLLVLLLSCTDTGVCSIQLKSFCSRVLAPLSGIHWLLWLTEECPIHPGVLGFGSNRCCFFTF